jgi:CubicO group peptidase (beta-lactamase class C family)
MAHTPGFEDSAMGHLFGADADAVLPLREYLQPLPAGARAPAWGIPAYSNYGTAVAGLIVENVSGDALGRLRRAATCSSRSACATAPSASPGAQIAAPMTVAPA